MPRFTVTLSAIDQLFWAKAPMPQTVVLARTFSAHRTSSGPVR